MTIGIYSTKGGVGKSSLAFAIASDLKYNLHTNDIVDYLTKYRKAKFYTKFQLRENTIYDFGGFKDKHADQFAKEIDLLIIPVLNDVNSVMRAIEAGRKFSETNKVFIANAVETTKDISQIKKVLNHFFNSPDILIIKKTSLLKTAMEKGLSPREYSKQVKHSHVYKNILGEYNILLKKIISFN